MMANLHETNIYWRILLPVFSQLAVICLIIGIVILFRQKAGVRKQALTWVLMLLNLGVYGMIRLEDHTAAIGSGLLHIPCLVLLIITVISLGITVWMILSETTNRTNISQRSIKESFDTLPAGVCFFDETGLPVLCNRAMNRFSFAVSGEDLQFVTDARRWLSDTFVPSQGVRRDGRVFLLPDGKAWQVEETALAWGDAQIYTRFTALEVTDLHNSQVRLMRENAQLRRVQKELQRLSANVASMTREEEILNTKMRVHDEMGRCLLAAQQCLSRDAEGSIPDHVATLWKRAVSMLRQSGSEPEEDMLLQIRQTCEAVNLAFLQTGNLPRGQQEAYLLTCAIRECVTNAIRYADATQLYARFSETDTQATVEVANNGRPPEKEIQEGGGLSTLRRRVERAGGTMTVESLPTFLLTVSVPKEKEELP